MFNALGFRGLFAGWVGVLASACFAAPALPPVSSPDGQLQMALQFSGPQWRYTVQRAGRAVLLPSRLGLKLQGADFSQGLRFVSATPVLAISERYEMAVGKKREHQHLAQERRYSFVNAQKQALELTVRVANDGVAFRYRVPARAAQTQRFVEEFSSFKFATSARAWLQPMSLAKSGWSRVNPAYEEHYQVDVAVGTPSPIAAGWVFPALFRSGNDDWVALSEAGLSGSFHASRLHAASPGGEYTIAGPDAREVMPGGELLAHSRGDFITPWRLMAIGSLRTVFESTLGTDLAEPAKPFDAKLVQPGIAAWSWAILKDEATVFDVQKRFIDYAADMQWNYSLIDSGWDVTIGYERVAELVQHAAEKGVGILLWYNSAGSWNDTKMTPQGALLTHEQRVREFARLRQMGVKGVKVDFFGGDGASVMAYYQDILQDAADAGLLVNFHGATLPRGWARTWPNLMSAEAVKGFEFATFSQPDQDRVAQHVAMLPYTRNLFDPMDFTPLVFGELPNIIRSTRNGFELAQAVVFTSGIQHMAEIPEGMATVPPFVKALLQNLPRRWDETRFIAGVPGQTVVLARRSGSTWHVAGLNATGADVALKLDLGFMQGRSAQLITDGAASGRELVALQAKAGTATEVVMKPRGGFVAVFAP
jgi:alpha-glucosidase